MVQSDIGLHGASACELAEIAGRFKSDIYIEKDGRRSNAASVLGILCQGVVKGTQAKFIIEGSDEAQAAEALERFIKEKL